MTTVSGKAQTPDNVFAVIRGSKVDPDCIDSSEWNTIIFAVIKISSWKFLPFQSVSKIMDEHILHGTRCEKKMVPLDAPPNSMFLYGFCLKSRPHGVFGGLMVADTSPEQEWPRGPSTDEYPRGEYLPVEELHLLVDKKKHFFILRVRWAEPWILERVDLIKVNLHSFLGHSSGRSAFGWTILDMLSKAQERATRTLQERGKFAADSNVMLQEIRDRVGTNHPSFWYRQLLHHNSK